MADSRKRKSNLEMANEMFKAAFSVKKQKFHLKFPKLSEVELQKMTVAYFVELHEN